MLTFVVLVENIDGDLRKIKKYTELLDKELALAAQNDVDIFFKRMSDLKDKVDAAMQKVTVDYDAMQLLFVDVAKLYGEDAKSFVSYLIEFFEAINTFVKQVQASQKAIATKKADLEKKQRASVAAVKPRKPEPENSTTTTPVKPTDKNVQSPVTPDSNKQNNVQDSPSTPKILNDKNILNDLSKTLYEGTVIKNRFMQRKGTLKKGFRLPNAMEEKK